MNNNWGDDRMNSNDWDREPSHKRRRTGIPYFFFEEIVLKMTSVCNFYFI